MGFEDGFLVGKIVAFLPAIKADFADDAALIEFCIEEGFPIGCAILDEPGVDSVARDDPGVFAREAGDVVPISVDGSVDDGAGNSDLIERRKDLRKVRGEPGVLKVVVGVEEQREIMKYEL